MRLKTLALLFSFFHLNLTENSVLAGGPIDPSPSNNDKLCRGECLRNGEQLTSRNGKFSLVITEGGAVYVINNETEQITNWIYGGIPPCPVEICFDPSALKLYITTCGVITFQRNLIILGPGCLQITDDGRVIIVDKDGKEVGEIFNNPNGR
jgi:hypothetical protein